MDGRVSQVSTINKGAEVLLDGSFFRVFSFLPPISKQVDLQQSFQSFAHPNSFSLPYVALACISPLIFFHLLPMELLAVNWNAESSRYRPRLLALQPICCVLITPWFAIEHLQFGLWSFVWLVWSSHKRAHGWKGGMEHSSSVVCAVLKSEPSFAPPPWHGDGVLPDRSCLCSNCVLSSD